MDAKERMLRLHLRKLGRRKNMRSLCLGINDVLTQAILESKRLLITLLRAKRAWLEAEVQDTDELVNQVSKIAQALEQKFLDRYKQMRELYDDTDEKKGR